MIHIVTVHWKDDRWVDIQLSYVKRHITKPFKTYAFLNDLPKDHRQKFFYASEETIQAHEIKINLLADIAAHHATDPSDWLIFLDGDAFPIGDIVSYGEEKLAKYPLVAVQRRENAGTLWPHPSFCLTTVGFWQHIRGNWHRRYVNGKPVTDVGGVLHQTLIADNIEWFPMLRTNKRNLHRLWFGIYDDLIYHHGAGFRVPIAAIDHKTPNVSWRLIKLYNRIYEMLPPYALKFYTSLYNPLRSIIRENQRLSDEVFTSIQQDERFYCSFISAS